MNLFEVYWQEKPGASLCTYAIQSEISGDFTGGPVVKTCASNVRCTGSIPVEGNEIPAWSGPQIKKNICHTTNISCTGRCTDEEFNGSIPLAVVCLVFLFFCFFFLNDSLAWKWKCQSLSPVQLFVTLWTVACQVPLSMGFSRQEYWSGLPLSSPGVLLDPCLLHCRQIFYHLSHQGSLAYLNIFLVLQKQQQAARRKSDVLNFRVSVT